ncbi:MAG: hypothetical protein FWF78_06415 [Defluviitaleaceae bacterium]|nr:hypothetical protein [Defluviitaleaceae bacterium]
MTMINNMHLAKVAGLQKIDTHRKPETVATQPPSVNFHDILFSKHAALRLDDRNINLSGEQMERITDGIGKAEQRGIRDSLVLVDDVALVVNVKSRTVITAVNQVTNEGIFNNIDGAVIV